MGCRGGIHPSRGVGANANLRGPSRTPPPTAHPGIGSGGRSPLIRPCGATFPRGGRQGLYPSRGVCGGASLHGASRTPPPLRFTREWAAEGCGGVGAPRPTDGDMETLWGLRGHPFPGRRTVGAGHARPGGWRGHPSMVRPVGRGLDPSAGGCPGDGCWRKVAPHPALRGHLPPRGKARVVGEGFIPPGVLAAAQASAGRRGRRPLRFARERAAVGGRGGVGAPRPTDGDMETLRGLRGHPFPGRRTVGAGHARPGGCVGTRQRFGP